MTRKEARAAGQITYQGPACKQCGGTERFTSSGECVECDSAKRKSAQRETARATRMIRQLDSMPIMSGHTDAAKNNTPTVAGPASKRSARQRRE